jgi:RimJ/RimL family protein N-acetyltransferase/N-acetylglutamate synthase-like GNAT family acetyltransferase
MTVPEFHTERLRLRGHRLDDFDAFAAIWADPVVNRYFGNPLSIEDSWTKFLRYTGHWAMRGFGFWALEEKATGRYAGELGFADFKRGIVPPLPEVPEAGWVLASWAHGKGFATEALRPVLEWIDSRAPRTVCVIAGDNSASLRVAEKCGFRETGRAVYRDRPVVVFGRTATFRLRQATTADIPVLESLIEISVRELQAGDYSQAQIEGALSRVFGVDTQLIEDGSYFVVEAGSTIVACGGWSKRKTLYGGDQLIGREDSLLDPRADAAKIRAFFVHPWWTRLGLGSMILEACENAAEAAGFGSFEMGATLTGVALYRSRGYEAVEEIGVPLDNGLTLPVIRMGKSASRRDP